MDYAAEDMISDQESNVKDINDIVIHPQYNQPARIYTYSSEEKCDKNVDVFLDCIDAASSCSEKGFSALKVTALGNPLLLKRMSDAIREANNLFAKFDIDGDGHVSRTKFSEAYRMFFKDADDKLPYLLDNLDPKGENEIDYITFSRLLSPEDLPRITAKCKNVGPLSLATPSVEEIDLMHEMHSRAHILAQKAVKSETRLLIDAEHFEVQPAIDNLVLELQQKYNALNKSDVPIIFHTYQCYLKDSAFRVKMDLERSHRYSYHFGAKLVRGAYMIHERKRARELNYPSPIHGDVIDTHDCYDKIVEYLLRKKKSSAPGSKLEIMCATHNQESIEKVIKLMTELNLHNEGEPSVHFAQLYGMADHLTFTLGEHGYSACKYVPYGEVEEVMAYLIRRAQENSDFLGNASKEVSLLMKALKKKLTTHPI